VVFLKKQVRQCAFRQAQPLVSSVIQTQSTQTLRLGASAAFFVVVVALLSPVAYTIYTRHVVIGDMFPVNSVVRLIDAREREMTTHYSSDIEVLRRQAEWRVQPKEVVLQDVDTSLKRGSTSWWDNGPHYADAIVFRMNGEARALPASSRGEASLVFALPELPELSASKPRILVDRWPMEPVLVNGKYYWAVGGWVLHESHQDAAVAAIRAIGVVVGVLAGLVLAALLGFSVAKH
jgi:hypothetical protein